MATIFTEREYVTDKPDRRRPKRSCSCCGKFFQPTIRRRMLCAQCFSGDTAQWRPGFDPSIPSDKTGVW